MVSVSDLTCDLLRFRVLGAITVIHMSFHFYQYSVLVSLQTISRTTSTDHDFDITAGWSVIFHHVLDHQITAFYVWALQYEIDYGQGIEQVTEIVAFYKWAVQCEINYRKGIEQATETCERDHTLAGMKSLN